MSAIEALRLARENGVRLGVAGADLILDADREPAPRVLEAIRRHKAGIVALLTAADGDRTAEDWQAFFHERAGIAEFDGGESRADAEALAFEFCIVEWLNRHPEHSDPGRCAWCGKPDRDGHAVVPFGAEGHGHTWLHPECWNAWHDNRRKKAEDALAQLGLGAITAKLETVARSIQVSFFSNAWAKCRLSARSGLLYHQEQTSEEGPRQGRS